MDRDPRHPVLPALPAPPAFVERRRAFRRAEDRAVHEERVLLARALDVLAGPGPADAQAADLLALVAGVVGAERAAVVAEGPDRRVLVCARPGEDPADARALAAWLDANAPRPAAVRAATGPAEIVVVRARKLRGGWRRAIDPDDTDRDDHADGVGDDGGRRLLLDTPGSALRVAVEVAAPEDRARAARRLPPDALRHLLAALAVAASRATDEAERELHRARERERERFVSMVAHELRTPLTGLGGYLDLLAAGAVDDPEVGHEFVERGRGIVERMAALVGDLLELSRLEAGSLRLELEPVSLAEACERSLAPLQPMAAARGIRLVADLPSRIRTARADRRRLEQVLTNLAANACKFAPDGGLVEIAARVEGAVAVIVVRDDGAGIEPGDRDRIFRPFARLERHDKVPGTGLGLPISRDLARAMGGDVVVASVPDAGTAFVVGIPATPAVPREAVAATLAAVAEREELGLEERAVLRAIRAGQAGATTPRRPGRPGDERAAGAAAIGPIAEIA